MFRSFVNVDTCRVLWCRWECVQVWIIGLSSSATVFSWCSERCLADVELIPSLHVLCYVAIKTLLTDLDVRLGQLGRQYAMFTIVNQTRTHQGRRRFMSYKLPHQSLNAEVQCFRAEVQSIAPVFIAGDVRCFAFYWVSLAWGIWWLCLWDLIGGLNKTLWHCGEGPFETKSECFHSEDHLFSGPLTHILAVK